MRRGASDVEYRRRGKSPYVSVKDTQGVQKIKIYFNNKIFTKKIREKKVTFSTKRRIRKTASSFFNALVRSNPSSDDENSIVFDKRNRRSILGENMRNILCSKKKKFIFTIF